jgi:methylated-DNA-protein-cysteine methyltransferase related protein
VTRRRTAAPTDADVDGKGTGKVDATLTPFEQAIVRVIDATEPGDVVTYGEVATEAGYPGRARAVGAYLAKSDGAHPWWRVVTASGRLVPGAEDEHARRLHAEGIETRNGHVRRTRR